MIAPNAQANSEQDLNQTSGALRQAENDRRYKYLSLTAKLLIQKTNVSNCVLDLLWSLKLEN